MPIQKIARGKMGYLFLFMILIAISYTVGTWNGRRIDGVNASPERNAILYYHCPMHPGFQSDKPGTAPCCGMELEPVHAGDDVSAGKKSLPQGVLQISTEKQQAIGVRTAIVEKTSAERTLRLLGRVAADELRVYKIRAAVDGWIQTIQPITVGQMVRKGQLLASFYAPDFYGPQQNYILAVANQEKKVYPDQWKTVQSYEDSLRGFGMDPAQLEDIKRTRQISRNILLRAPVTGYVTAREVSLDYRFLKGEELYRIAELDKLWIYADLFEDESRYVRTGATARITHPQLHEHFEARVSDVLSQFDPVTRTMKIRLDVDNPGHILRPDMFVDVEFPLNHPPALTVPSEAVLDTGVQKTVFVDLGNGTFEPRRVETGWRMNNQVEITGGLMEGERIVVSGNFLIDSESRLQGLASGYKENEQTDPVCGMKVDPAKATTLKSVKGDKTYYFCSKMCKDSFDADPSKYLPKSGPEKSPAAKHDMKTSGKSAHSAEVAENRKAAKSDPKAAVKKSDTAKKIFKDPICGMDVDATLPGVLKSEYEGKTYYFCSSHCKKTFDQDPGKYRIEPDHH